MARLITFMLLCSTLAGCELVADFDRSKIPEERPDSSVDDDAGAPDGAVDDDASIDEDEDAGDPDPGPGSDEDAG